MSTITILHEGEWKPAKIVGYGANGALQGAMLNEPCVTMQVTGTSFAPKVELAAGSTATVYWMDTVTGRQLATGVNPTITWQTAATRTIGLRVDDGPTPKFQDVRVLNFGFNAAEDSGTYNIGSGYNYASQPVTGIANLQFLVNLRYFLAAGTPLTGHVDFTGLSQLEHIECFNAHVQSLNLTGCTSLIRLCMEANSLSNLDLNPVRGNLRDLRAAVQNAPSLTFATLSGPMTQLYHYCIRDQTVLNIIPHAQLPVIEEHWAWNTSQTTSDAPTSSLLRSYASYGNAYDQASVDLILTTLASLITNGAWRSVDISGGAIPSAPGLAAAATLRNNGWTVLIAEPATRPLPVPIAAYGFNENIGTIAYDSSGNGRDVSLPTGSTWTTGHNGSGFNASTISTYGGRTQIAMGSLSAFTLMAWVYVTSDGEGVVFNFASAESYGADTTVGVNLEVGGDVLAAWSNPGGPNWSEVYAASILTINSWHHIALASDGDNLTTFLDGSAVSTNSWALPPAAYSLNIGNDFIHQIFPNTIDDVRVFDTALTAAEVTTYMNTAIKGVYISPQQLLGSWPMSDSLADVSGNNLTAIADTSVGGEDDTWTPTYTDGPLPGSRAVVFGDIGQSINYGRTGLEPSTVGFSWMAWFFVPNGAHKPAAIFGRPRAGGSTRSSVVYGDNYHSRLFWCMRWLDDLHYDYSVDDPAGSWHHIAIVDTDTIAAVYLDGAEIQSFSRALSGTMVWEDFNWRSGWMGQDLADGSAGLQLSMVRMYHGALGQAQIQSEMNRVDDNTFTLLDTPTYTVVIASEPENYTLGTEFNVVDNCELVAIRWWQGTGTPDLSTRTANVWRLTGGTWVAQLAEPVEIPGSAAADTWLRGDLDTPITLTPGVYRVGVFHPHGHFSASTGYFAGNTLVTRGPLTLPYQDIATNNQQGNYSAEATIHAPDQPPYQSRNYWADVVVRAL